MPSVTSLELNDFYLWDTSELDYLLRPYPNVAKLALHHVFWAPPSIKGPKRLPGSPKVVPPVTELHVVYFGVGHVSCTVLHIPSLVYNLPCGKDDYHNHPTNRVALKLMLEAFSTLQKLILNIGVIMMLGPEGAYAWLFPSPSLTLMSVALM